MNNVIKKKILLVDDNRMMLNFLTNILEKEGYHVISAEDGFAALDILTTFTPDIIFIDLIMPKIGGEKLCRIVRKMQHLADCYIVIISAAVAEMEMDYTEIGADTCIAKGPFAKMAEHVLAAVRESDSSRRQDGSKQIVGLDGVFARQMTKELLSRKKHLETILESIAEGILEVYSERVVYANSAAVSLFDKPLENLLTCYFFDLFDKALQPRVKPLLKIKPGESAEIGMKNPLELKNRLVTIKSLSVKDAPFTTIILITDLTESRRLQMQLQHVQKMEAIGTIASGVAHNFRNTLAGILVNNQVLQLNYKDNSDLLKITERIDNSVNRGVQLVDGLLQFSRKQTKKEFQKFNLAAVIQETYQLIKESFDKKIVIHTDFPSSIRIMGDYSGLSLALMNLYTNARDAMPEGGELRIEARQEKKSAVVVISDTGHGMDKDTIEKCFDPFYTTKDIGRGTGLGLSTTYGIVKSHGGKIDVFSEPNKGSVFRLSFPTIIDDEHGEKDPLPAVVYGRGEKVLVVDDEIDMLEAAPALLESLGYRAEIAVSGKEAVSKYKVWNPDVVLIDIGMPGMDGYTCMEKILEFDSNAKAVVISGYQKDDFNDSDNDRKKYVRGYLTKPVGVRELGAVLAQLFNPE